MHLTKRIAATLAALLIPAAMAFAAGSPSGTFGGTLHSKNGWGDGRPDTFKVDASFEKGKLNGIQGNGNFIPYNPKLSNATAGCGSANSFNLATVQGDVFTSKKPTKPDTFSWVVTGKYHVVVRLKGLWASATVANTQFRFYEGHLPYYNKTTHQSSATGHCDSGWLTLKLTEVSG